MTEFLSDEAQLRTYAFEANALRLSAARARSVARRCLDEESIAAFAEGTITSSDRAIAAAHLATCAHCREEVASVARLVEAPAVKRAIGNIPAVGGGRHWGRVISGTVVIGALAAGLVFMLVPTSSKLTQPRYREESVTGAAAPRLVAPLGVVSAPDSFRWTSVPRADRYRVTVFARDGSVIGEAETRDTAITLTDFVRQAPDDSILWRVEAHVGWEDRWASSELAMLTVRRKAR